MVKLSFCEDGGQCEHLDYRNFNEKRKTFTRWHSYCTLCRTTPQHANDCKKSIKDHVNGCQKREDPEKEAAPAGDAQ